MLVYLDASIVIDASDPSSALHSRMLPALQTISPSDTCVSDLVRLKCLVQPIRMGNVTRIVALTAFFAQTDVLAIESPAFDLAAHLRAHHPSLKTADALHLATALHHRCAEFWTNDRDLAKVPVALVFRSF